MMNVWPTYTRIQTPLAAVLSHFQATLFKRLSIYCLVFSWQEEKSTEGELVLELCLGSTGELERRRKLYVLRKKIWAHNGHYNGSFSLLFTTLQRSASTIVDVSLKRNSNLQINKVLSWTFPVLRAMRHQYITSNFNKGYLKSSWLSLFSWIL